MELGVTHIGGDFLTMNLDHPKRKLSGKGRKNEIIKFFEHKTLSSHQLSATPIIFPIFSPNLEAPKKLFSKTIFESLETSNILIWKEHKEEKMANIHHLPYWFS